MPSLGPNLVAERNLLAILYVLGVDDLPRGARVDVRGVGLGALVGGNCLVLEEVRRCIRDNMGTSDAENLSRVNVETVLVDVGVVGLPRALALETLRVKRAYIKLGRINSVSCLNPHASITWFNNVAMKRDQVCALVAGKNRGHTWLCSRRLRYPSR